MSASRQLAVTVIAVLGLGAGAIAADTTGPHGVPREKAREELRAITAQVQTLSRAMELVHEIVAPCVVSVHTRETVTSPFRGGTREMEVGEGSGFIVRTTATQSYVLTNAHVVVQRDRFGNAGKYDRLRVELNDNRQVDAEYIGYDEQTDLAVIRLPLGNMPTVDWADSDQAHVGQFVMALGYPLGVGYSASQGIVSATDRSTGIYQSVGGFESFIQTDAAINPGNSGGPLVDLSAKILGVNANIVSRTGANIGLGFAIPANLAKRVSDDLIDHRKVRRPAVGVQLSELTAEESGQAGLAKTPAIRIDQIIPMTPAADAGLRAGDVVLAINNLKVQTAHQFRARVAAMLPEKPLTLKIWRGQAEMEVRIQPITLDELRAKLDAIAAKQPKLTLERFGLVLAADENSAKLGLRVANVDESLQEALRSGDRILRERSIGALNSLEDAKALTERNTLILLVQRGERSFWLTLRR